MGGVRRILILAFDDAQSLDVTGPTEVFSLAGRIADAPYDVELVAPSAQPITTNSGLTLVPKRAAHAVRGPVDTLVVAGGSGVERALTDERLVRWVARTA